MINPIKFIVCEIILGHKICIKDNIMEDVMINPYSYICPCYRCGCYIAYDSTSGMVVPLTKKGAEKWKAEFIRDMHITLTPEEIHKIRKEIYGE